MSAPVILVDPLPRTLDLIMEPDVRARLERLGRVVVSEDKPMDDATIDALLPETALIFGQTAMPAERIARAPKLKAIIIPAGIGLPAAARALEQAGLLGKVKLTGVGPATLLAKYIKSGSAQDIWWNVSDLGYLTYYAAQALAKCEISGKEGETFKAGKLGEYKVGKNGEVILGPAKIVTPENLSQFPF